MLVHFEGLGNAAIVVFFEKLQVFEDGEKRVFIQKKMWKGLVVLDQRCYSNMLCEAAVGVADLCTWV